jgi:hypothetical protein
VSHLRGPLHVLGAYRVGDGNNLISIGPGNDPWIANQASGSITHLSASGAYFDTYDINPISVNKKFYFRALPIRILAQQDYIWILSQVRKCAYNALETRPCGSRWERSKRNMGRSGQI